MSVRGFLLGVDYLSLELSVLAGAGIISAAISGIHLEVDGSRTEECYDCVVVEGATVMDNGPMDVGINFTAEMGAGGRAVWLDAPP